MENTQKTLAEEIDDIGVRMNEVTADRTKNGGAFFELEEQINVLGKEVARLKTQSNLKASACKDDQENMKLLQSALEEVFIIHQ